MSDNKKKWLCFDFDGVVATYDGWRGFDVLGEPILETIETMRKLKAEGFSITIFTTRVSTPTIIEWLKSNDVPYDSINSNAHNPTCTSQKPIYHCMIDDRAVRYFGQDMLALYGEIMHVVNKGI